MTAGRRRRGFTLAEMILALAVLSLVGVLIARLFVLSSQLADRARVLDRATVLCANILETWKSGPDAEALSRIPELQDMPDGRNGALALDADLDPLPDPESWTDARYLLIVTVVEDAGLERMRLTLAPATLQPTDAADPDARRMLMPAEDPLHEVVVHFRFPVPTPEPTPEPTVEPDGGDGGDGEGGDGG